MAQSTNACSFHICDLDPCGPPAGIFDPNTVPVTAWRLQHASLRMAWVELRQSRYPSMAVLVEK